MKSPFLFSLLLLACAPSYLAEQIQSKTSLSDLGMLRPDRLSGVQAQKDYYLPLPSRIFDANASHIHVDVQPSPFLTPDSVVGIWINDRPVGTARVGKGGPLVLEGPIPRGTRADDPTRNILKLTVKTDLGLTAASPGETATTDRDAAWVDVLPTSTFSSSFDNASADWLSVGRLAVTLRPRVEVVAPAAAVPLQTDLALKLASWVAQNSLHSELHFSDSVPDTKISDVDRFVIEPRSADEPQIEIVADGADRVVHIRANAQSDATAIWNTLQVAEHIPMPGNGWTATIEADSNSSKKAGAFLRDLDGGATSLNKGTGDTTCAFHFDLSRLTRTPADLLLHLEGTMSPEPADAEPTLAVLLNGRLIFSEVLPASSKTFDCRMPLPSAQLLGNNEISVLMIPATESHSVYFWQLSPESSLEVTGGTKPNEFLGLLDAALRFAGGTPYQVWLATSGDWKTAAYAVAWLQRINPSHLLEPVLADKLSASVPAIIVGSMSGKAPSGISASPVSIKDGRLSIHSSKDASMLSLPSGGGLGIWQLGELAAGTPAILLDKWGANGATALESVSEQMADSVWVEGGDVILGDGVAPVLTFATREAALPLPSELPGSITKTNPASQPEIAGASISVGTSDWMQFRWWVVGGLWLVLSAIIVWIFEQGRRRAAS